MAVPLPWVVLHLPESLLLAAPLQPPLPVATLLVLQPGRMTWIWTWIWACPWIMIAVPTRTSRLLLLSMMPPAAPRCGNGRGWPVARRVPLLPRLLVQSL